MVKTLRPTEVMELQYHNSIAESVHLLAPSVECVHWVSSQVLANSLETNASSASGHCSNADIGARMESLITRVHSMIAISRILL